MIIRQSSSSETISLYSIFLAPNTLRHLPLTFVTSKRINEIRCKSKMKQRQEEFSICGSWKSKQHSASFYFLIKHEFLVRSLSVESLLVSREDLRKVSKPKIKRQFEYNGNWLASKQASRKPSPRIFFCHLITEANEWVASLNQLKCCVIGWLSIKQKLVAVNVIDVLQFQHHRRVLCKKQKLRLWCAEQAVAVVVAAVRR